MVIDVEKKNEGWFVAGVINKKESLKLRDKADCVMSELAG